MVHITLSLQELIPFVHKIIPFLMVACLKDISVWSNELQFLITTLWNLVTISDTKMSFLGLIIVHIAIWHHELLALIHENVHYYAVQSLNQVILINFIKLVTMSSTKISWLSSKMVNIIIFLKGFLPLICLRNYHLRFLLFSSIFKSNFAKLWLNA